MPFLRAALIKRKIEAEPEPAMPDDRQEELPVIDDAEEDIRQPESISAPEEVSAVSEDIHDTEDALDVDNVPEVQEEEEGQEEPEPEPEPEVIVPDTEEALPTEPEEPEAEVTVPDTEEPYTETEPQPEPEPEEPEIEPEPEPEPEEEPAPKQNKDYSGANLQYDFTSGERYVDTVSTKTEFDKMLDELAAISGDLLSHEVEKFAVKFTGKFQGDNDKAEADAKKYEAFLGGYITNAAMILYDNGYRDAAIKRLDQAKSILEARKKLEDETEAIKTRVEEEDDAVDLSDILGLLGD